MACRWQPGTCATSRPRASASSTHSNSADDPAATRTSHMQHLTRNISRCLALSGPERHMLFAALALLPLFRVALRVVGLQRLQARLYRKPRPGATQPALDELKRTGALVNAAAQRVLGRDNCLPRSLYLWWLLRRRDVHCQLRIGVRMADGALEAHAWVEHAGVPINDRADVSDHFPAFDDAVSPSRFLLR